VSIRRAASDAVFQLHEIGEVACVQIWVQAPEDERPRGPRLARPEPPSAALPATVAVPVSGEPGSVVVPAWTHV
jgi:hypothetical protein